MMHVMRVAVPLALAALADAVGFVTGRVRKGHARSGAGPSGPPPLHPGIFGLLCNIAIVGGFFAASDQGARIVIRAAGGVLVGCGVFLAFISFLVWAYAPWENS
jgi:hypothetical protein